MKETTEREILKLVAYFEVFHYPLTKDEIHSFLSGDKREIEEHISDLSDQGIISIQGDYVGVGDLKFKKNRRETGNQKALGLKRKAEKNASLISKFPFVRGVLISGSFSKGFVGEDGDIDYFIITKPGRLWIARTTLILYKKLFLLNSHEFFCVNYFVDEKHLEIEEKNIFTATELITLLPMVNKRLYKDLLNANSWVKEYYPSLFHDNPVIQNHKKSVFSKVSEAGLKGKLGNKLDDYFMKVTLKKWKKKFGSLSNEDFEVAMKTSTNVSKHHPNNFQKKVLEKHAEIYRSLIDSHQANQHVKAAV